MHKIIPLLLTAAALLSFSPPAMAQGPEGDLTLGAGWFDFNRSNDSSVNFSGEWRGNAFFYDLKPMLGVTVNTDGGVYGYGGFAYDWEFLPHWAIVPGLAIGGWSRGNSIDLGGAFEFHESAELDYKFDNRDRVGIAISHTSNADIYNRNPGVNTLMATFTLPLNF